MTFRKRIAVVGGGVAGLGAAWALRENADVVLYDKAPRFGGHAWTVDIDHTGKRLPVDIGFICFNRPNYPNFTKLLQHLDVKTVWTDMAFAVTDPNGYEWSSDPWGLFAWKRNALDPKFRGLLAEIVDFNNVARAELMSGRVPDKSLGEWLDGHRYSELFRTAYLLPMSAAIWSTPEQMMLDYPVRAFLQFFENHRLMHTVRPIWRTVAGGSRSYVDRLMADMKPTLRPAAQIETIRPGGAGKVQIVERGCAPETFDAAILSCHADESRRMLDPRYDDQRLALGSVRFSQNTAYLHHDASLMPERRMAWASWNVRKGPDDRVCVTYWMNRLQKLPKDRQVFVTLNPVREPAKDKTFGVYEFDHPMYDGPSAAARRSVQRIQGRDGLIFAGSWLGDGFHEAGLRTGLEAAFALGGSVPWEATTQHKHTLAHTSMAAPVGALACGGCAMKPAAQIWFGSTSHVREKPFRRAFKHRIAMLEIDIGRIEEADELSRLFSIGKGNAISFRASDYGARSPAIPPRAWAEGRYAEAGISLNGGAVRLLTFPRVLGYGFAPISIWQGYGPDGDLRGVIYEVHNTFGETHSYVSAFSQADVRDRAEKAFHVSPFFEVSGEYRFTLRPGNDTMALVVENMSADGRRHVASLALRATALSTPAILKWLVTMPMSGLGVLIAINWQALGLWLKGARYRAKPEQRAVRSTLTWPEQKPAAPPEDFRKRA